MAGHATLHHQCDGVAAVAQDLNGGRVFDVFEADAVDSDDAVVDSVKIDMRVVSRSLSFVKSYKT